MDLTLFGIDNDVKPLQPLNAEFPMEVIPSGHSIFESAEQPLNSLSEILITPAGNFIEESFLHPEKTPVPHESTSSGKVIVARLLQLAKAELPTDLTLFGIFISSSAERVWNLYFIKCRKTLELIISYGSNTFRQLY